MDALITERIGMSIANFFAKEVKLNSVKLSHKCLRNWLILIKSFQLVAALSSIRLTERFQQNPETIYLKSDFETLYDRIEHDTENVRPLFVNNSKEAFKEIFDGRQEMYEAAANRIIDVAGKTPEEIVEEIG